MFLSDYTRREAEHVLAAMLSIAPDNGNPHHPSKGFALSVRDHLLQHPEIALSGLPASTPTALNRSLSQPHKARQAMQLLVLMPYLSGDLDGDAIGRVEAYAEELRLHPDSLNDLKLIGEKRLKKALFDYGRRALNAFFPGNALQQIAASLREVHTMLGDRKQLVRYLALEHQPQGSLGRTIYNFYTDRRFHFPGEMGNLGEFAVRHDCVHILCGANTDMKGEIAVGGVEAGMARTPYGWEMLAEVIIDFHMGIAWSLPPGIAPGTMNFDPEMVSKGLAMGAEMHCDLLSDWNFWDDIETPLLELRQRFGINGVSIIDMPAPGDHPNATSVYWSCA